MKRFFLMATFVAIATVTFSQSVDLDKFYAKFTTRNLPTNPLPKENRSFTVVPNFSSYAASVYDPAEFAANGVKLVGLENKKSGAALTISFTFTGIDVKELNVQEVRREEKDKNGAITAVNITYMGTIKYSYSSSYAFTGADGKTVESSSLHDDWKVETYNSAEFKEYKEAASYIKMNKDLIIDKYIRQFIGTASIEITKAAERRFAYKSSTDHVGFWYLGSEKHPEFQAHTDNWKAVLAVVEKMNENGGVSEAREMIKPLIAYLEDAKSRFTEDNKKHRKMRYASFFNIAKLYMLTDQPDEAVKQAEGLIANDYDTGDGKDFIKEAGRLKGALSLNGVETRHFPVGVAAAN